MTTITGSYKTPREKLSLISSYLGKRVLRLTFLSFWVGVALFAVELAFGFTLQAFLVTLGIMPKEKAGLPDWFPVDSTRWVLAVILLAGLARAFLQWTQQYIQSASVEILRFRHRRRILQWAFHLESANSSAVSILFGERAGTASNIFSQFLTVLIQATAALLIFVGLMALSVPLTIILIIALAFLAFPFKKIDALIEKNGASLAREWDATHGKLMSNLRNLLLVQIYGTQDKEEKAALATLQRYLKHCIQVSHLTGLKYGVSQAVGAIFICFLTYVIYKFSFLPGSAVVTYFYLCVRLIQNSSQVGQNISAIRQYLPQFRMMFQWWEENAEKTRLEALSRSKAIESTVPFKSALGWKFEDVTFAFNPEKPIFKRYSFEVSPGQVLLISGPSGCGKSTLLNLMLGCLKPQSGSVLVSEASHSQTSPLEEIKNRLLPSLGYVGPESFLFEGTVEENLVYGLHHQPSSKEIEEVLEISECDFIKPGPEGLQHRLTEQGQGLSAGQKQRLCLARAFLRKPSALILDEATANLDIDTELKLVQRLAQLKSKITLIIVSHRPALHDLADQHIRLTNTN